MDGGDRRLARFTPVHEFEGAIGADRGQVGGEIARAASHVLVESAAGEQKRKQHQGAVEIGGALVGDGLKYRQAEREHDAERNRHVHVERAASQRSRGAGEERHAGIGRAGQRDEGGKPVEEIAGGGVRVAVRSRPQRNREQHHVHRRESGDAEAAQKLLLGCLLEAVGCPRRERMGRIAERLQPLEDRRRLERALVPFNRDPFAGQIDARAAHAGLLAQPALDCGDAGAAVDAFDNEIHRSDAVDRTPYVKRQVQRVRHHRGGFASVSATTILFSLRNTRSEPRFASITRSQRPGRTGVATPS